MGYANLGYYELATGVVFLNLHNPSDPHNLEGVSSNHTNFKSNMDNTAQTQAISGQWCLVTVRQWKRDSFVRYLNNDIEQKHLQELLLEVIEPEESVYDNMVLLRVSSYPEARKVLQQIDHFQSIQRLKLEEVSRMLNS